MMLKRLTSLSFALQDYINSDQPFLGQKLHSYIIKTGFEPNLNIAIKLLIIHLKSSNLSYARQVFDELPQRTLSAYNYMISGYTKHGFVEKAFELFRHLTFSNEKADGFTFSMVLKGSSCGSTVSRTRFSGKEVHSQVLKSGIESDDVLHTALVDSYVKAGRFDYARRVFDLMLDKNVVCATSIITGYMNEGLVVAAEDIFYRIIENEKDVVVFNSMIEGYSKSIKTAKKAVQVFMDMKRVNLRPTISTFASIIGACSVLSAFETGQQVQGLLVKTEFFTDVKMGSALLDMYSKCGRTEDARTIFNYMPDKNVYSWTSMIDGYGKNGDPFEALELFNRMRLESIKPNYVTLLSALSACAHAGLVGKGLEVFDCMSRDYSSKPRMEHYACMVDIFGRAGCLHQALKFIQEMPEIPNSDVWAPLLSSARLHGDLDMANLAAKELFQLDCHYRPGAYVSLSNTLAEVGRWDNVIDLRESMKTRGKSKDRGSEGMHIGGVGIEEGVGFSPMRKSFKDSLKVLEADIQHANTLASDFSREYDGACLQMRMSYSPAAHFFLLLVQWTDCHLAGALGLLRILIYKAYVDGTTTMSTHE